MNQDLTDNSIIRKKIGKDKGMEYEVPVSRPYCRIKQMQRMEVLLLEVPTQILATLGTARAIFSVRSPRTVVTVS